MQHLPKPPGKRSGKTMSIDFTPSGSHRTRSSISQNKARNKRISSNSSSDQDDCSSDAASPECADQDQSDEEEADDQSGDAKDPAVHAPSDELHVGEDQTGPNSNPSKIPAMDGQERIDSIFPLEDSQSSSSSSYSATGMDALSRGEAVSDDEGDDDYDDVDLISDSGDEELSVEHTEEKAIIQSEEARQELLSPTDAFSVTSADWVEGDPSVGRLFSDDLFFEEQISLFDPDACARDTEQYELANKYRSPTPTPTNQTPRRRVRFAPTPPVDASASFFPDLNNFEAASSLRGDKVSPQHGTNTLGDSHESDHSRERTRSEAVPPSLRTPYRRAIEKAKSESRDDDEASSGSLSGYETDDGDTTAEEDVPASATFRPSSLWKSSSSALNNRLAQQPLPKAPTSKLPPGHEWGPTLGTWVTDPTKATAVVASSGKELIITPALRPAKDGGKAFPTLNNSVESSAHASPVTPLSKHIPLSQPNTPTSEIKLKEKASRDVATSMLTASSNLMMSGLGLGNANTISGHAIGPPEAFFPFQSIEADGKIVVDGLEATYDDDDDDDHEGDLNIEDFISFGEDDEDDEDNHNEPASAAESHQSPVIGLSDQTEEMSSALLSPTSPTSPHTFLDHLNKGKVTAFRRTQLDFELDYAFNGDGLASSSSHAISNAIKSNAFAATTAAMDSHKKRKMSGDFDTLLAHDPTLTKRRMIDI
ncbi:MAG: hypothetical protein Q9222_006162 [Ikaeria aurantiellina]